MEKYSKKGIEVVQFTCNGVWCKLSGVTEFIPISMIENWLDEMKSL